MTFPFSPQAKTIVVHVVLTGPAAQTGNFRFALDTGAARSLVNLKALQTVGYDPATSGLPTQIVTASQAIPAFRLPVDKISALGLERMGLSVICHDLPSSMGLDGLLGLDFFRGQVLTIDFRAGQISVA